MTGDNIRVKAVIFDLDDTLIAEDEYIRSGYRHVAGVLSARIGEDAGTIFNILINLFHMSPQNVFNRLFDKLDIPYTKDHIMEFVEAYRNHLPDVQFYSDVLPCLEQLKAQGIMTGIITDGFISTQRNKLKVLGADTFFDHIIMTDELGREYWKPHPRAFEMMRDKLAVEFDEMLYIGDNPKKDFYISKFQPMKTVRINRKNGVYDGRPYLENIKEHYTIQSMAELIDLCKGG